MTKGQEELLVKVEKFLKGSDQIFILTGKPGVGKTTMVKILLGHLIRIDKRDSSQINVAGITLSHKAKSVLGQHIPNVFTFAKAYGMKEVITENGGRTFEYNPYQEEDVIGEMQIPVFVHDEISQYTPEMIRIVMEKTSMFSKVILMGDKAQLPPIDPENIMAIDEDSPIFDLDVPDDCRHELTERVRQAKGNPILELSDVIREEIEGDKDLSRVIKAMNEPVMVNGQGYGHVTKDDYLRRMNIECSLEDCSIAFRNKTVGQMNNETRNFLMNRPVDRLVDGDVVCMLDNYYKIVDGKIVYVLYNSDVYKVYDVFTKVLRFSDGKTTYSVETYEASIEGHPTKRLILPTHKGQKELDDILKLVADKCKKRLVKWEKFWDIKKMFCNCSYAYAITAYKCQGSTYRTVYLDVEDIMQTGPLTPKRKLQTIYTAITRASKDVYFFKKAHSKAALPAMPPPPPADLFN